jgi:predicted cupin superfamily sugar epimerase
VPDRAADQIIRLLDLKPHPEGETFRDPRTIDAVAGKSSGLEQFSKRVSAECQ